MAYATKTDVSVHDSIGHIGQTVRKYGCDQFTYAVADDRAMVAFNKEGRQVRFYVSFADKDPQRRRSLMRAMLLVIKAKLEAAEAGVETFEEAFLAQLVLPDGRRVGDVVKADLALAYDGGAEPPHLLPDFTAGRG